MILAPLLLAGTLTAQILDDTRGLGARGAPPRPAGYEQMRRIAESLNAVKHNFVDALEEGPLVDRCVAAMDKHLGAEAPKLAPGTRGGERIGEYWRALTAREADTAKLDRTADACLHGMVDKLDRRTEYMDREKFRELMVGAQGAAGIGLEMEVIDGVVTVVTPIEGAPAERAGIGAGDRLLEVDGVSTAGKTLDDVAKLLRGRKGSTAVVSISRQGGAPVRREVGRDIIRVNTVKWRVLDGGVVYVRASQFAERTPDLFREALDKGRTQAGAGFSGVILDLRGNPGGLFYGCIAMSAAFLPETAAVVETRGRGEDASRRYFARPADYERRSSAYAARASQVPQDVRDAPLVVIVNRGSAACSEIVAAAMQDHKRAKVVGERTFGLGTVQTIMPLGGSSALRLTTARFYRPNGEEIEEKGVTPDLPVVFPERFRRYAEPEDPALPVALKALQK